MTDYTYNTGNPIGSTDVRDGVDNLKSFDVLLNSTADTYQDRLGDTVPTAAGAIKRLGPVVTTWTFTTGGTLNHPSEAALNPADGNFYGWTGVFPRVVAPGTDPTLPGSGYVPRTDVVLRDELAESDSDVLIAGQPANEVAKYNAPYVGGVDRKLKDRLNDRVSIRDFGVMGDGTDETTKIQAAVSAVCGSWRTLVVPPPLVGSHYICQDIQFPNTSWGLEAEGGATAVQFSTPIGVSNQNIFDLTGCNGPAKHITGIGFGRLTSGSYDGITGILTDGTNGLNLTRVWFRGLFNAGNFSGAFFELYGVVCEYNFQATRFTTPPHESIVNGITYYKNEHDLLLPSGDLSTFIHTNSTHIGTKTQAIFIHGSSATISNVSAKDDGTGYLPKIVRITGRNNTVSNISTTFGSDAVVIEGAAAVGNKIIGLDAIGVKRGVFISEGERNKIIGAEIISASVAGMRIDTAGRTEIHATSTEACAIGLSINAVSELRMYGGGFRSSVTSDTAQDFANSTDPRFYGVHGNLAPITTAVYI